jgi:hypothetical protein
MASEQLRDKIWELLIDDKFIPTRTPDAFNKSVASGDLIDWAVFVLDWHDKHRAEHADAEARALVDALTCSAFSYASMETEEGIKLGFAEIEERETAVLARMCGPSPREEAAWVLGLKEQLEHTNEVLTAAIEAMETWDRRREIDDAAVQRACRMFYEDDDDYIKNWPILSKHMRAALEAAIGGQP